MEEHFVGKVAQKVILVRSDGKVLITRDARDGDVWEIPGGRMNVGEQPAQALTRELEEELGIVNQSVVPFSVDSVFHEGVTMLLVTYVGVVSDSSIEFTINPVEIAEFAWVNSEELSEYRLFPFLKALLETYFANQI